MGNASVAGYGAYLRSLIAPAAAAMLSTRVAEAERIAIEMRGRIHNVSGHLSESIQVIVSGQTVKIVAGGPLTTKYYGRGGYAREVKIGQGDNANIGAGSEGVSYDYALAEEFGTHKENANPFFFITLRVNRDAYSGTVRTAGAKALSAS